MAPPGGGLNQFQIGYNPTGAANNSHNILQGNDTSPGLSPSQKNTVTFDTTIGSTFYVGLSCGSYATTNQGSEANWLTADLDLTMLNNRPAEDRRRRQPDRRWRRWRRSHQRWRRRRRSYQRWGRRLGRRRRYRHRRREYGEQFEQYDCGRTRTPASPGGVIRRRHDRDASCRDEHLGPSSLPQEAGLDHHRLQRVHECVVRGQWRFLLHGPRRQEAGPARLQQDCPRRRHHIQRFQPHRDPAARQAREGPSAGDRLRRYFGGQRIDNERKFDADPELRTRRSRIMGGRSHSSGWKPLGNDRFCRDTDSFQERTPRRTGRTAETRIRGQTFGIKRGIWAECVVGQDNRVLTE